MPFDNEIGASSDMNRRKMLRGVAAGASLFGGVGIATADRGSSGPGKASEEFAGSKFKLRSAAHDDLSVIKNSDALSELRQTVSEKTGRTVEDVLPLSIEIESQHKRMNSLNPSLAVSLLKEPDASWENTTPKDLGVLFAGVVDEPDTEIDSGLSVQSSDGTGRVPVSASAVTLHDDPTSVSRSSKSGRPDDDSESRVAYEFFSHQEGNGIVQSQRTGQLPEAPSVDTISAQSTDLPASVTPEVVESYRDHNHVSPQSIHGEIGCTTCKAVIPAICAGVGQLGFYGCATRCLPLTSTYPVLAAACGVFCRYVTTVQGAALCAAAPVIICEAAFGC
ncbi:MULTISPECIES: hypothetical protein [Halomicrobium]|nr:MULTISPECIES: hypothetical protein [Halomicrobium]QCD65356.1 hypothetical protein E5139_06800 [Halomicrobium mukohataei]QFR20162.1 hypothetical protein GBQ70_06795 [Halomicrobium sp. ZPS1]